VVEVKVVAEAEAEAVLEVGEATLHITVEQGDTRPLASMVSRLP